MKTKLLINYHEIGLELWHRLYDKSCALGNVKLRIADTNEPGPEKAEIA